MAGKKLSNIEIWNARVKNASWYKYTGKQGIHYEYLLPQGANEDKFYEEAIDIRSKKGNNRRRSTNGTLYRPGAYQPVGDKRFFTYYRMRKMKMNEEEYLSYLQELWLQEKFNRYMEYLTRKGY